jgi:hypothetical protein
MTDTPQADSGIFPTHDVRKVPASKLPSVITFAVGVLLFFLPFAEVKCNNATLLDNTGLGIVIGTEWRTSENSLLGNDMFRQDNTRETSKIQSKKQDPNVFAIAGFAFGVIGLLLSFSNARTGIKGATISGVLAAAALIGLFIDLKRKIKGSMGDMNDAGSQNDLTGNMQISIGFTPWFYISLLAFLLAAFLSYRRKV